jgi:Helix-turn-helix.
MMKKHWTSVNVKDFAFAISMDFVGDLELVMDKNGISQKDLADRLGISEGRVSQVVNNPGNLTLKSAVEWARALGHNVALVVYDDGAQPGKTGPLVPEVFRSCWQALGKPTNGDALAHAISIVTRLGVNPFGSLVEANDNRTGWKDVKGGLKLWSRERERQHWKGTSTPVDCCASAHEQAGTACQCMVGG